MLGIPFQQEQDIVLEEEKPDKMNEKEWVWINRLACNTICLSHQEIEVSVYNRHMCKASCRRSWKKIGIQ